jgi:hypothetical protein
MFQTNILLPPLGLSEECLAVHDSCCGVVLGPYSPIQEKHVCWLYLYLLICCRSTECPNTITVGSILRKQLEHFIMGTIT